MNTVKIFNLYDFFFLFILVFNFAPHVAVLKVYIWLWAQRSLLAALERSFMVLGIKLGLKTYKANALILVLFL